MGDACVVNSTLISLGDNLKHFPSLDVSRKACNGFEDFTFVMIGFKRKDRNLIEKLAHATGATCDSKLSYTQNLISICNTSAGTANLDKYKKAVESEIPRLNVVWLYDSIMEGVPKKTSSYIVKFESSSEKKEERKKNQVSKGLGINFGESLHIGIQKISQRMPLAFSKPKIEKDPLQSLKLPFSKPKMEINPEVGSPPIVSGNSPPKLSFNRPPPVLVFNEPESMNVDDEFQPNNFRRRTSPSQNSMPPRLEKDDAIEVLTPSSQKVKPVARPSSISNESKKVIRGFDSINLSQKKIEIIESEEENSPMQIEKNSPPTFDASKIKSFIFRLQTQ